MNGKRSSPVLRGDRRSDAAVLPDPIPSRVSHVWNMGTVRHEALHDRAEVKGLRRRVVAATRLELRAA